MKIAQLIVVACALVAFAGCATAPEPDLFASGTCPPKVLRQFDPIYPFDLYQKGVTGEAVVEYTIDINGNVTDAKLIKATHAEFGILSLDCIRKWKYRPSMKDGHPVEVIQQHVFPFENAKR